MVDLVFQPAFGRQSLPVGAVLDDVHHGRGAHVAAVLARQPLDFLDPRFVTIECGCRHEHPIRLATSEVDPDLGVAGTHDHGTRRTNRFGTHHPAVALIELPFELDTLFRSPEVLQQGGELVRHVVGAIVRDRFLHAEGGLLPGGVTGHDVEAPASFGDEVDGGAELREVEGMELVGDVGRREQAELLGDGSQGRRRRQEIDVAVVVVRSPALTDPPREGHLVIEAHLLGELNQARGAVPMPEILVALRIRKNTFRGRHAALDVPGEETQLHGIAGSRLRLAARIEGTAEDFGFAETGHAQEPLSEGAARSAAVFSSSTLNVSEDRATP